MCTDNNIYLYTLVSCLQPAADTRIFLLTKYTTVYKHRQEEYILDYVDCLYW